MSIGTLKTLSKQTTRRPTARVKIIWGDSGAERAEIVRNTPLNRAHIKNQIISGRGIPSRWAYCDTELPYGRHLTLDDDIRAMPSVINGLAPNGNSYGGPHLVGWWGKSGGYSDESGNFPVIDTPEIELLFIPITIDRYTIRGFSPYNEYPVDFDVVIEYGNNEHYIDHVFGNTQVLLTRSAPHKLSDARRVTLTISKWSQPGAYVKITLLSVGYGEEYGADDIKSMDILVENEGGIGTLPVGNISCNELTLSLQNIDGRFFFGNTGSPLSNSTRINRRVEPSLGFDSELLPLGVYWTHEWTIADQDANASTTATDRLGLLQAVQYNGIGQLNNDDNDATNSRWENQTLYTIATEILNDLKYMYMQDMEFDIDEKLSSVTVPLAFFDNASYFDVIKTIAQSALAFAYMDTPTDEEKAAAASRGNDNCMDMLRIKSLESFSPTSDTSGGADVLTLDDIITKTISKKQTDITTVVEVKISEFRIESDGSISEVDPYYLDENAPMIGIGGGGNLDATRIGQYVSVKNEEAIREYGRVVHRYEDNALIQTEEHATNIARRILYAFGSTQYVAELQVFGDITQRVGDMVDIPEYVKDNINSRGLYAVTKVQTEYDGGIRQNLSCRRLNAVGGDQ